MQVAIFLSSLGILRGGLETIAARFAAGLAGRGHQVTCVASRCFGRSLPADLGGMPVSWLRVPGLPADLSLGPYGRSRRARAWWLKAQSLSFVAVCRWHPDVRRLLQMADVSLSLLEIETVYLSRWRRERGGAHLSYFPGVIDGRWLDRDRSTVRVAISRTIAEASGVRVDGVVAPGIDAAWLGGVYEVAARAQNLLFVGRLEANKGIWELLQIFEGLEQREPHRLRLRVVGDGPLRQAMAGEVERRGLAQQITFLGAIPAASVLEELRRADLFLFPSHYESFGIAVVEAQAAGLPVVCSDLRALREAAGGAARLLPPRDVERWVVAVQSLLGDRRARQHLSQSGRQNAQNFTWERSVQALEGYLEQARQQAPSAHGA